MIKGVTFDLEGNWIDGEFAHFQALWHAAKEVGIHFDPNNTAEDMSRRIPNAIGGGDAVNAEGIARLIDPEAPIEEIRRRAMEIRGRKDYFYEAIIEGSDSIKPREGSMEVFEQIRSRGLPTAIASMTARKHASVLLARSGIGKLFPKHLILLGESVKHIKPAPDVYLEAARRMRIHPCNQLVFEDSVTGLKAARAAGSPTVAMPVYISRENIERLKAENPVRICISWTEIDSAALEALLNI